MSARGTARRDGSTTPGSTVAIGTDSLASAPDLNMFAELAALRRAGADGAGVALLESATRGGARALGFDAEARHDRAGQVRAGCSPSICRRTSIDVEEYLVSGVPAGSGALGGHDAAARTSGTREAQSHPCAPIFRSSASATRSSRCRLRWPARCWPRAHTPVTWRTVGWIWWRWWRRAAPRWDSTAWWTRGFDALNPRTAKREMPRGAMTRREAAAFVAVASVVFVFAPSRLNPLCFALLAGRARDRVLVFAREALHDLDAAVSRPGDGGRAGRRLAGGRRTRRLGAVAARPGDRAWVGGFDVLYACQDLEFDRAHGLRLDPGALRRRALAR